MELLHGWGLVNTILLSVHDWAEISAVISNKLQKAAYSVGRIRTLFVGLQAYVNI